MARVFTCAGCGAELTNPLRLVPLPLHAFAVHGNGTEMPVLMARGTYAAVPGGILLAPGDIGGTRLVPERRGRTACCGLNGDGGPNLDCLACGLAVGTRIDDCSLWQEVWLLPDAVRAVPASPPPLLDWAEVVRERTPPWGPDGRWEVRWDLELSLTLAHLLTAADGAPVAVPDGLLADLLRRTLDGYLPPGRPPRRLALAGPGLPEPAAELVLVPVHPQTAVPWQPSGYAAAVPLAAEVWSWLAFPEEVRRPATGGLPPGVERDEPLGVLPLREFLFDLRLTHQVLHRLSYAP